MIMPSRRATGLHDDCRIDHRLARPCDVERADDVSDVIRTTLQQIGPAAELLLRQPRKHVGTGMVREDHDPAARHQLAHPHACRQSSVWTIEWLPFGEHEIEDGRIRLCRWQCLDQFGGCTVLIDLLDVRRADQRAGEEVPEERLIV